MVRLKQELVSEPYSVCMSPSEVITYLLTTWRTVDENGHKFFKEE